MKDKERLRNYSDSKKTKETWKLHAVCNPGLDPGPRKKTARLIIIGTSDKIWVWAMDLITVLNQCKFPEFD